MQNRGTMNIWVDADACPKAIKAVICKAAERKKIPTLFVANHFVSVPPSKVIKSLQVAQGFDVADNTIVERMQKDDLVITGDIPLAAEVIANQGIALNPRGTLYDQDNIKDALRRRASAEHRRDLGHASGGPPALDKKVVQQFANGLDRILAKVQATPDSGTTAHCVQDTPTRTKYALVVEDTDLDGAQLRPRLITFASASTQSPCACRR